MAATVFFALITVVLVVCVRRAEDTGPGHRDCDVLAFSAATDLFFLSSVNIMMGEVGNTTNVGVGVTLFGSTAGGHGHGHRQDGDTQEDRHENKV
jgi:hypothetical protein